MSTKNNSSVKYKLNLMAELVSACH